MRFTEWWTKEQAHRTRAPRYAGNSLVAYYWDGGSPARHPVKDISATGAYICAKERWYVGTVLRITFQEQSLAGDQQPTAAGGPPIADLFFSVSCRIVRHDSDGGMGVCFVFAEDKERKALRRFLRKTVERVPS